MPDVRMPDGTVISNVPEGTTQSELLRRYGAHQQKFGYVTDNGYQTPEMKAAPDDPNIAQKMYKEVSDLVAQGDQKIPLFERESFHEKSIPVLGALSSLLVPGGGWGALALQSLMAGAGGATGELIRQQQTREPTDVKGAAKYGVEQAAGNFVGGSIVKGLGAASKKIFSSPLSEPAAAAADFAKQEGAPFPLSSAMPGSGAARTQQATRLLLPGEIRTQTDANKVAQFLNQKVSTIVDNASPVDEAAAHGQQFLRQVFEPGETSYTQTFKTLRDTVGDQTPIPLTNTLDAMKGVSNALKNRGETKTVYNRFRNILNAAPTEQTAQQMDELYSGILKDAAKNANARPEANVVLNAITKDIDAVSQQFGMSFEDAMTAAKGVRDQFRELRNIPQLERLSRDFGSSGGTLGSRQWMSELFTNPNGKALAEIRTQNPDLYHELADSWLASNLNRFSRPTDSSIGKVLDGKSLRTWFEQNEPALKTILGAPQTKALDNFSIYAQHMSGAVSRANVGSKGLDPTAMLFRAGAEGAGAIKSPLLFIPGEASSYVLAKGLSDPNSQLFKVFTQGFSPATRNVMVRTGQLAGQATADGTGQR